MIGLSMATVGAAGAATAAQPWPGTSPARVADVAGVLGGNVSGLAPAGADGLWAVRDAPGALLALDRSGDQWTQRPGWEGGRPLRYPDGHAGPDAEAVTTVAGDPGAVYVGAERDNAASSARRNSVLRFDTGGSGPLQATIEWRLDDLVPGSGANTGIEGLAWVPDDVLVAGGLRDLGGRPYDPAAYPSHRAGLFVVGAEQRGDLSVVALTDDGRATLVSTVATGLASVMEVHWDAAHQQLWALCDDNCDGTAVVLRPGGSGFETVAVLQPPAGSASLNDEGFARLACRDGRSLAVWSDDGATGGHALRTSVLPCAAIGGASGTAGATTAPTGSPVTPVTVPPSVPPGSGPSGSVPPGSGQAPTTATTGAVAPAADAGGSATVSPVVLVGLAVGLGLSAGGTAVVLRRRRRVGGDRP